MLRELQLRIQDKGIEDMKKRDVTLFIILFITIFSLSAMDGIIASSSNSLSDTQKHFSLLHSLMQGTYLPQEDGLLVTDSDDEKYTITFSELHDIVQELDEVMEKDVSNEMRLHSLMNHSELFFPRYSMMLEEELQEPIIKSNAAMSELVAYLRYLQTDEAKLCSLLTIFFECADVSFVEQESAYKQKKERLPHYKRLAQKHHIYDCNLGHLLAIGRLKRVEFLEAEWKQRYSVNILDGVERLLHIMHVCSFDDRSKIELDMLRALKTSREIDIPYEDAITSAETEEIKTILRIEDVQI